MPRIPIEEATATQLAEFATIHLGLADINFRMGKDAILARMAAVGFNDGHIDWGPSSPAAVQAPGAASAPSAAAGDAKPTRRMVKINISADDKPGGQRPVPVSVNGKAMLIPRGQDVEVPWEYYMALKNAKMRIKDPSPDGGLMPAREVQSYPFSVVA